MIEVWLHSFSFVGRVVETARWAERNGFEGMLLADSQTLNAEIWVELAMAAAATERLLLGPGVTNPVTRHPSVTASAAATLHTESYGRAVLGLGRGDSALRQIGHEPVDLQQLEESVVAIQAYLRGEPAELDGFESRIAWIAGQAAGLPKVPVHVAASGPQAIGIAARHADGVDFTVGAEIDRLRWAVAVARKAGDARHVAAAAGAGEEATLGAYVNVAVDPDPVIAADLVRGSAAIFARFSAEGAPPDGLSETTREGIAAIAAGYDESEHGRASAVHAKELGDDFIERFAVAGPAETVAERLAEIADLGIERLIVVPCSLDTDHVALERSNELFASEVLPRLAEAG